MKLFILLFIITLLSSCYSIYVPTVPNITPFNKKYEGHFELAARDPGFQLATGFSVTDHICLQYNSQFGNNRYDEISAGVFNFIGKTAFNQITVGLGKGITNYQNSMNGEESVFNFAKGHYNRYYFQFYSSFHHNKKNLWGIAIRLSFADFKLTETQKPFQYLTGHTFNVRYFEPYLTYSSELFNRFSLSFFMGFLVNYGDVVHHDLKSIDPQCGISLILKINNKSKEQDSK